MSSQSFRLKPGGASSCLVIELTELRLEVASCRLSVVPPEVSNSPTQQ